MRPTPTDPPQALHILGENHPPGDLITVNDAKLLGLDPRDLSARYRAGKLDRLRRGAYVVPGVKDPVARHRSMIQAARPLLKPDTVISHVSAAVWLGLDVPWGLLGDDAIHVTRGDRGGSIRQRLVTHTAPVPSGQWQLVDGLRVTTPARTVVDVARTGPKPEAVALADHVLRTRGAAIRDEMTRIIAKDAGRHGIAKARVVLAFADPRAESGGESISRVLLAHEGLPTPELQWEVRDPRGNFVARCDLGWPEHHTAGEFDGRLKYQGAGAPSKDPGAVVYREKLREDRLRGLGLEVVRWTWADLEDPHALATRIRRALDRGRGR
ncbi:type IV toxin-antitoxin system AbiEi family antitoxin domain-containing protein [Raineyella fluvialis]|uniref:AbiEi antitoxin N-terminal domain-containing protein n=1 Tax=Raineyella fluvialis TaxID=2662261 RepID=A0A5Q2FB48_9ACTN|nr:type IV toxin-antitoxin system AbiEi family antitoxin domain-containing protein [Raineyella fluvialis]QGF23621.1 hypothetical protein Rai3103_08010 [Raineyella fluvialis]